MNSAPSGHDSVCDVRDHQGAPRDLREDGSHVATTVVADGSNASLNAQDTSNGHDGSDGFSRWIGNATVTVKIAK